VNGPAAPTMRVMAARRPSPAMSGRAVSFSGVLWLQATVGLLTWGGALLLIDAASRRHQRANLVDRLGPFQPSVADEAQDWLRQQL
jgi:hypothetical protein